VGAKTQKCRGTDPQIVANPHIFKKIRTMEARLLQTFCLKQFLYRTLFQNFVPELRPSTPASSPRIIYIQLLNVVEFSSPADVVMVPPVPLSSRTSLEKTRTDFTY